MKQKTVQLGIVIMLSLFITSVSAQQVAVSSGGNVSSTGGSMSYSVGQVIYTPVSSNIGKIDQGVQYAYEISIFSATPEIDKDAILCTIAPNPVDNFIVLTTPDNSENWSYRLYNTDGKLLTFKTGLSNKTYILMSNLVASTYFLKIISKNKEIKTFKIIKK